MKIGIGLGLSYFRPVPTLTALEQYINAVKAAGVTVTGTQQTAIETFVNGETSAGRWSLVKRFYLPVWGVAAANAICMKTALSGTFVGSVTHADGYVMPTDTTGHFRTDATAIVTSSLGMATGNASIFKLKLTTPTALQAISGARDGSPFIGIGRTASSAIESFWSPTFTNRPTVPGGNIQGAFMGSNTATNSRFVMNHVGSVGVNSVNLTTVLPSVNPYFMGQNISNTSVANVCVDEQFGVYGCGLAFSQAQALPFLGAVKTLWETVTGLVVP